MEPDEAAVVGDTIADDVEGALALGMRAFLLDRDGPPPGFEPRLDDLYGLPAVLGLLPTPPRVDLTHVRVGGLGGRGLLLPR